jgi:hypothetical protein
MRRATFIAVTLLVVLIGAFNVHSVARAAASSRFEYLHLTPGLPRPDPAPVKFRQGYQACVAGAAAQKCREFEDPEWQERALDTALATLGNEGWELVSVIDRSGTGTPKGLTYIFKRQLP